MASQALGSANYAYECGRLVVQREKSKPMDYDLGSGLGYLIGEGHSRDPCR